MTTQTLVYGVDSSPWTCPAGVTSVKVECWGGGGSGGSGTGASHGGGGGAGAYSRLNAFVTVPGNTYAFLVGNTAVDTYWVNTSTCLAKAGTNGSGGAAGTGGQATSCVGDNKFNGGGGKSGTSSTPGGGGGSGGDQQNGTTATTSSGGAGGSVGGATGGAGNPSGVGGAGGTPGAGGGGGRKTPSSAGGAGAKGRIILTYTAVPPGTRNPLLRGGEMNPLTIGLKGKL